MKKIIIIFLSLSFIPAFAQWTQVNNGLGSLKIKGLAAVGNTLIATTEDQGLFVSTNFGDNWQAHPQNTNLPNFNIFFSEGDFLAYQGMTVLGQGFYAGVSDITIFAFPIQGIPNNNLSSFIFFDGGGSSDYTIFGTAGGGLFYGESFLSTTWTEITGLPDANSKIITGLFVFDDPNSNDEYLLVATRNGAYISSSPNSITSVSPKNQGLTGSALSINKLFGQIALTKNGVYIFPDDTGLNSGWQALIPSGDFRTLAYDILNQHIYFFGNQIGKLLDYGNGSVITDVDLSGITGGAITASFAYYPNIITPPGYLFVGTENGGVFRKQLLPTNVEDNSVVISDFHLSQNYPNPFNPSTTINFSLPTSGFVTLKVYDALGREVASLVNENKEAGNYSVVFDATGLSSGMYFYKLQFGSQTITKKMMLMK